MSKSNVKLLKNYTLLLLSLFVISCESEDTENTTYKENNVEKLASATFVSNPTIIKTHEILDGVWESFDSGIKSKWTFNGEELLKSNIYSFGEAGKPQKYTVTIQSACGGKISDTGEYLSFMLDDSDRGEICYHLESYSNSEIKMTSKHGHTIILKK
jgi:hypothetical protein